MIRVDFDVPSYLRLQQGLCIVSDRLAHKLPEPEHQETTQPLETVVINKLYRPQDRKQVAPIENQQPDEIKGEFIPRDSQPERQEKAVQDQAQDCTQV